MFCCLDHIALELLLCASLCAKQSAWCTLRLQAGRRVTEESFRKGYWQSSGQHQRNPQGWDGTGIHPEGTRGRAGVGRTQESSNTTRVL